LQITSVATKLAEHLTNQALGEPTETRTVRSTLNEILGKPRGFIQGDGVTAFNAVVDAIIKMLEDDVDQATKTSLTDFNPNVTIVMIEIYTENTSLKEQVVSTAESSNNIKR
jgi:hypothetical protein